MKFKKSQKKLQQEAEGAEKRQKIISDAEAMKRLQESPDFQRLCELLREDRESIRRKYEDKYNYVGREQKENIALLTRIIQINEVLKKPQSLIWTMEKMTEVRGAIKEKKKRKRNPT